AVGRFLGLGLVAFSANDLLFQRVLAQRLRRRRFVRIDVAFVAIDAGQLPPGVVDAVHRVVEGCFVNRQGQRFAALQRHREVGQAVTGQAVVVVGALGEQIVLHNMKQAIGRRQGHVALGVTVGADGKPLALQPLLGGVYVVRAVTIGADDGILRFAPGVAGEMGLLVAALAGERTRNLKFAQGIDLERWVRVLVAGR